MEQVILVDQANRPMLAGKPRQHMAESARHMLLALTTVTAMMPSLMNLDSSYERKVERDQFLANSQITEAEVTRCFSVPPLTPVVRNMILFDVTFDAAGETITASTGRTRADCADYQVGAVVPIRYLRSDPTVIEEIRSSFWHNSFYFLVAGLALLPIAIFIHLSRAFRVYERERKGRVIQGRVVRVQSVLGLWAWLHYEIPAKDGSVLTGKQMVTPAIGKKAEPGSLLAVHFAHKRNYGVL